MKLSKAIEIGKLMSKEKVYLLSPDVDNALQVLIEAGERIQHGRLLHNLHCRRRLPGETEE